MNPIAKIDYLVKHNCLVFVRDTGCFLCVAEAEIFTSIYPNVKVSLQSPASHRRCLGTIPSQSTWDL